MRTSPGRQGLGAAVPTRESLRLVRGEGRFVDDVELPGLVHAHVLRSPYPHARLRAIDTATARGSAGVLGVYVASDLGQLAEPLPMLFDDQEIEHRRAHVALAGDVVRFAGEPVALVVAESRAAAEDAAELIETDFDPLPAVRGVLEAVELRAPLVHQDLGTNIAGTVRVGRGNVDLAMKDAEQVIRFELRMERGASSPIETRGVVAAPDAASAGILVWASTQRPVKLRDAIARLLGLPSNQVRVLATDVGGGFGPKGMFVYPEEVLIPWAALRLGRPVKWIEDRLEHFSATSQLREQVHDIEVGVRADGTVLALRDHFLHDGGAYVPYGLSVPRYTAVTLAGPYRIPAWEAVYDVVYTNRTPTCPYRGSGGPFATFAIERTMDRVADLLGLERTEIRRRNLMAAKDLPYDADVAFADGRPTIHDGTPYGRMLDLVIERLDDAGFPARRAEAARRGRLLGRGVACYTEATGLRSFEGARVWINPSGQVSVAIGTSSQGQGHETTLAQVAADRLKTPLNTVTVIQGDTGAFGWGRGTYGSKVAVIGGNAVALAADRVAERALAAAARVLGRPTEDLLLDCGSVRARDGTASVSLAELVDGLLYAAGGPAAPETAPGLDATAFFSPERASIAGGTHGCEIEVDPDTGEARIVRYVAAADSGVVINEGVVDGQLRGAIAQGIGGALLERLVWDDAAVLVNGTLMDYLVPRIDSIPVIELVHADTPSRTNPLGVKGAGEAGIFPVSAVVCSALEDALGCGIDAPFLESPTLPDAIRRRASARGPVNSAGSAAMTDTVEEAPR